MDRVRLWKDCEKHGRTFALPLVEGCIEGYENWPPDVQNETRYPRICAKWLPRWCLPFVVGKLPDGIQDSMMCRTYATW
jgi:hypothetical protein